MDRYPPLPVPHPREKYGIAQIGGMGFHDNPHQVRLADLGLRLGECFFYDYDFGDHWQHQLRVEAILTLEPNCGYPICIAGKRACPSEDCGGLWYLWHGNVFHTLQEIESITMDLNAAMPETSHDVVPKLLTAVEEFQTYIEHNAGYIPNYGERWRYGERISTAFVGSAVNQVISTWIVKRQQMR